MDEQYNSAFTGQQIDEAINKVQNQAPILAGAAQTLTDAQKAQARKNIGAVSADEVPEAPVKGVDYWTDEDKKEITSEVASDETLIDTIAKTVKAEVPLVKVAEQPTFVNSVDEMTDTSKAYVLSSDGYLYAYMKGLPELLTTDEFFVLCTIGTNGVVSTSASTKTRIATIDLLPLSDVVSVDCPSPYQYFVYYYTDKDTDTYIGKTAWKSGSIENVANDVIASGTSDGAKYCRISLKEANSSGSLDGRFDEFMENITVMRNVEVCEWRSTGLAYNQPADYEDRIVALEKALEGLVYGAY